MLLLEPFWVYSSVAMCVACGRKDLVKEDNVWGNKIFSGILIMIAGIFVPVENWILHRHPDWETTFMVKNVSDSNLIALASLLHILITLLGYRISVFLLQRYGEDAVIKSVMWSFSVFFSTQGLFWDSLMYSGTYDEYHAGVEKSFLSFFYTDRFFDAYIIFFILYGPAFYYLTVTWNSGYTKEDRNSFIRKMGVEAALHAVIIYGAYVVLCCVGLLPPRFGLSRIFPMMLMHFVSHGLVILPLFLSSTKEHNE